MPHYEWSFAPDVPTYDFFGRMDLTAPEHLEELLFDYVYYLKKRIFLKWEAVVCHEQGLPLRRSQQRRLATLLAQEPGGRVLSIDEVPRPSLPWYEILRKLVPHMLVVPFRTWEPHNFEVHLLGWTRLIGSLEDYGQRLMLPPGVNTLAEVVAPDLRHRLALQCCFTPLDGLGQSEDLTLLNPKQLGRIEGFFEELEFHRESIDYLGLTVEKLMEVLVMPEPDQSILIDAVQEELGLRSLRDRIADSPRLNSQ